ncbi:MAG: type I-U CRISPR-associated helicase/endonuclease Cas3 [Roseovarius sp.]|nr:type I-U CRISPR-associated helicase/endonuclease Cas3 [Alphaproteobacteria bacterium]MCY4207977.1 type I-U CRISPR-associated helicase/endonuclease Cas3 [Roseovarius sp.]
MIGRSSFQQGSDLPPIPAFSDFYRAINGREPFPWQARLAENIGTDARWPSEVGVPTGLGKTACLDIALWWLASEAHVDPAMRRAPTRIWWVVNRRLLVDATAEHAERLARALGEPQFLAHKGAPGIIADVANRLRSLSAGHAAAPLEVIRLRGGVASESPTDPSRPTVVLCTLPMYGSRLLFRGYGSRLRPVDAAMAGTDSLVLLDEAHLAPHLTRLIPALAECAPAARDVLPAARSRPVLVSLTATGNHKSGSRLDLDESDLRDPVVRQRLDAAKSLELRNLADTSLGPKPGQVARLLADAAQEFVREAAGPASFLVFANTPDTAREAFDRLCKLEANSGTEVLLLTGRMREREAQMMRDRLLDPLHGMSATRNAGLARKRHLMVVATQTLEVGADIDAEYLVTEQCGVRALTQRLGRLNRLGEHHHARAIYLHFPSQVGGKNTGKAIWPVYEEEPQAVLKHLEKACFGDGRASLSPGRITEILGAPSDYPGQAPEVMPEILWEWTKTTVPPKGEAPVEPYYNGLKAPRYSVSLIWRAHVPDEGARLWPRATDREAIPVPIREVREALRDDEGIFRLASDGVTVERASSASALRPNDCVMLPSDRGLMDEFGWNPKACDPVVDISLIDKGLPLDPAALERLCGVTNLNSRIETATGRMRDEDEPDQADRDEAAAEILEAVRAAPRPRGWHAEEWQEFVGSLTAEVVCSRDEVARLRTARPLVETRVDEFDEHSITTEVQDLASHGRAVAERALSIAECIGIADDLRATIAMAGRFHDIGKSDLRFQRWLDPEGAAVSPVAKSNASRRHLWETLRRDSGWPRGGRHEALSARLLRARLEAGRDMSGSDELGELLIHLVISHHGKGRPLVAPVRDETGRTLISELEGITVEAPASLEDVDWDQPGRFRHLSHRFGPWGLALLEAIVIGADHAVSGGDLTETEMTSCRK